KKRAAMKHETLLALIKDGIPENIGRQQVTGKLDAVKCECQRTRQRLGERCLANAGDVFDQKMTACQQTGDGELNRLVLAYDNFTNLLCESVDGVRHPEMICGNAALRKRVMGSGSALPSLLMFRHWIG